MLTSLTRNCSIAQVGEIFLIICDNTDDFERIIKNQKEIKQLISDRCAATNNRWTEILVRSKEGDMATLRPFSPGIEHKPQMEILNIPAEELIAQTLSFEKPSSIVRINDGRGLLVNQYSKQCSGVSQKDWVGKKMDSYWLPDELDTYMERLYADVELRNYRYVAYLMTGQKAEFTVNSRLVNFNDSLCRWVQTLDCSVIQ